MSGRTKRAFLPAWNWEELPKGTAEWRAAWEDLGKWVGWYTETYELWQSMPVCWFQHSRLVEELRALRFHHQAVIAPLIPVKGEDGVVKTSGPVARAYSEWMTTRRDWERIVLGLDPRDHGGCTGLVHLPLNDTTATGRADRLKRMERGLTAELDLTLPGPRRRKG